MLEKLAKQCSKQQSPEGIATDFVSILKPILAGNLKSCLIFNIGGKFKWGSNGLYCLIFNIVSIHNPFLATVYHLQFWREIQMGFERPIKRDSV